MQSPALRAQVRGRFTNLGNQNSVCAASVWDGPAEGQLEKVTGRRDAPPDVGDSLFRPQPKDDPI